MKFWVGVTDNNWFGFLADLKPDEVNFWRPSGKTFGVIDTGAPFLFKLHSPLDFIVGGGFFVRSYTLPLTLAWDAFHSKNGAPDIQSLRSLIQGHRPNIGFNPEIGCIILNEPFFFPRDLWIKIPASWKSNIVSGKKYNTTETDGRELWKQVEEKIIQLRIEQPGIGQTSLALPETPAYGQEYLTRARLGQGAFRILVTDAYHRRCSITGERTLPVLQASHIKPLSQEGPNRTDNGLLLRSDLHILFDKGYMTVTPDYRVEVSRRIREEFNNGKLYYPLHGNFIQNLPDDPGDHPDKEFLRWHNEEVYVG
ncbi:MAG: HNH endonuclease [Candidatus Zixiibacteriota bacterium]